MWFDTHCHLHLCDHDAAEAIVDRARGAGVMHVVTVGIDLESSRSAVESARAHELHATVGLHPNSADDWNEELWQEIVELAALPEVVGIGESGLDFFRDESTPQQQEKVFNAHIELARKLDKALVIHTRASVEEALDQLERVSPPARFVFHCWSGELNELERAVALGAHVSFAGNVSFKNAPSLRAAAAAVPAERLLVETDSPFLSPEPNRGKPNEPANVVHVGSAVAAARGVPAREIAELTTANALALYDLQ